MTTVVADPQGGPTESAMLSAGQTGNGVSTNVLDRGTAAGPALVRITTAIGATPTCTYLIEVSPDGTNWLQAPYADSASPTSIVVATFVITTATTAWKSIATSLPWRYLRVTFSANTNVTNTVEVYVF